MNEELLIPMQNYGGMWGQTWYQWVRGWVGAVESQTVAFAPMKATSNQKANP